MNSLVTKSWFGSTTSDAPPADIGRAHEVDEYASDLVSESEYSNRRVWGQSLTKSHSIRARNANRPWLSSYNDNSQMIAHQQKTLEHTNVSTTFETLAKSSIDGDFFLAPIRSSKNGGTELGQCSSSKTFRLIEWKDGFVDLTILRCSNGIRIITRNDLGGNEIDLEFLQAKGSEQLVSQVEGGIDFTLSVNPSDDQIALFSASLWSIKTSVAKFVVQGKYGEQVEMLAKAGKGEQAQEIPCQSINGVHRMTHDMVCTIPLPLILLLSVWSIRIPPDGRFSVFVPSAGGQVPIDVFECCKKHDIELWCSTRRQSFGIKTPAIDPSSAQAADMRVLDCVIQKIADAFRTGEWVEDVMDAVYFSIIYPPLIVLLYAGGLEASAYHDSSLLNLDHRNDKSCLCGGDEQTVMCDNRYGGGCRDLCKEFGKKQNCTYDCTYACEYDDKGRLRKEVGGYQRPIINTTGKPCCKTAISPCVEKSPCSEQNCTDCKWYCQKCRIWFGDKNCKTGYKAIYGSEYPGSNNKFKGTCCPERTTPDGLGSQPRSVGIFCNPEVEDRDSDRDSKIETIRFP